MYHHFFNYCNFYCILLRQNHNIPPLIGIDLCCNNSTCSDWLFGGNHYIVRKHPAVIFPRFRSDSEVRLALQCTVGMVGLRCWRCGGGLWDIDLWRDRGREGPRGEVEVEREVASVAAVIKLSSVRQAGSSVSLMSVCSFVLPCGPLLKRRPTMDEGCPLCAFVLYGEWITGLSTAQHDHSQWTLFSCSVTDVHPQSPPLCPA